MNNPLTEIERLFDELAAAGPGGADLAVDVVDRGDTFVVTADLPGYESVDIEVKLLADDRLQIAAERETEDEREEGRFVIRERSHGSESRTISLPAPVDGGDPEASFSDGVLTVRLPKVDAGDEASGTDIPVG